MKLPSGVIVLYKGTHASIPTGLSRDTDFDNRFIRGCSSGDVSGGGTGGQENHNHERTTHSHIVAGDTGTGANLTDSGITTVPPENHTHQAVEIPENPTELWFWNNANNNPAHITVLFLSSDGSVGIPNNIIGMWETDTPPNGFENDTDLQERMIKGANTGADGGTTGGSDTHTHTASTSHSHASQDSGQEISISAVSTRTGRGIADPKHTHKLTFRSTTPTLQNADSRPEYKSLNFIRNNSGGEKEVPNGLIALWKGDKADIPNYWSEYTAMRDYFVRGWSGSGSVILTGGNSFHAHEGNLHTHTVSAASASARYNSGSSFLSGASDRHTHVWDMSSEQVNGNNNPAESHYPPYIKVFFIKYNSPTVFYDSKFYDSKLLD